MRTLGTIVNLQVQVTSLKVGSPPRFKYDPAGIRHVPVLGISADGVEGRAADSTTISDVHNRTHPQSKNRAGTNGISIGFTSHYALMRSRFGDHLTDGIAGENILVDLAEPDDIFSESAFANGLLIRGRDKEDLLITAVIVAPPCAEFSRWALRFPDDARPDITVTEAVRFLHEGVRGFYCSYTGPRATIGVGDEILIP